MKKMLFVALLMMLPAMLFALGQAGSNLDFQAGQIVIVPDNALLDNLGQEYTIETWVNVPAINPAWSWQFLAEREDVFALVINSTTGKIEFYRRGTASILTSTGTLGTAAWHHVAVRRVQTSPGTYTTTILIDGVASGSTTDANFDLTGGGSKQLTLGNTTYTGFLYMYPVMGKMDEVRFWTVARTDAQIQSNRGVPLAGSTTGLLAYYKLDEGTGQTAGDATANALNGALGTTGGADVNDPTWGVSDAPVGFNLVAPNGGALNCGAALNITWAANPAVPQVDILYSLDAGASWTVMAYQVANNGLLNTYVPGVATNQGRFRVADAADASKFDDSDANIIFNIGALVPASFDFEAEAGTLNGIHMYTGHDGRAFGCTFIYSSRNYQYENFAAFNFTVVTPGLYVIWARESGPGGERNSWKFSMDGGAVMDFHVKSAGYKWQWERVTHGPSINTPILKPVIFNLAAGAHTIRFIDRENYTRLDRIIITNDLNPGWLGPEPTKWINITDPADDMYAPDNLPKVYRNLPYTVKWESQNIGSTVSIDFSSTGDAGPFTRVATSVPNTGSYVWTVPNILTDMGCLAISKGSGSTCPLDVVFENFDITDPPPEVTLNAPNGGETFYAGHTADITWLSKYYTGTMNLSLSTDNGTTWSSVVTGTADDGTYTWTIPAVASAQCLVKVAGTATGAPNDLSDAVFTIALAPPAPPANITVTEPNGGESWEVGGVHAVTWTVSDYAGNVNVYYSINNGTDWTLLADNLPATGMFEWTIPNTASTQCLVKVVDTATGTPFDVSDAVFSIVPVGMPGPAADYALQFDGVNDIVDVAGDPSLNVSSRFTIEFWMKTNNPTQKWRRILEKGSWDEYYISFYGETKKMGGALRTAIPGGSRMDNVLGPSTSLILPDTWVHVAATFDGSTAKFFINGVEESSKPATAAPRSLISDLIIGGAKHGDVYEYHYDGLLDELRIWNIDRSAADITSSMFVHLSGSEPGLVAYYDFNEGSGQILNDASAHTNHGRLGKADGTDDSDPTWVLSDKPTSITTLATLPQSPSRFTEESEMMEELPQEFELMQNYPNPFNAGTTIDYNVPNASGESITVTLEVYDLQGRLIRTLVNGVGEPGRHQAVWNGTDERGSMASSGVYFYRLRAGNFIETKSMVMLK